MGIEIGQDAFSCARNYILGLACQTSLDISTIPATPTSQRFEAQNFITSDVTIVNPMDIVYTAGIEIDLLAAFEVEFGATFLAEISPCQ